LSQALYLLLLSIIGQATTAMQGKQVFTSDEVG